jgi:hypothetical protein
MMITESKLKKIEKKNIGELIFPPYYITTFFPFITNEQTYNS